MYPSLRGNPHFFYRKTVNICEFTHLPTSHRAFLPATFCESIRGVLVSWNNLWKDENTDFLRLFWWSKSPRFFSIFTPGSWWSSWKRVWVSANQDQDHGRWIGLLEMIFFSNLPNSKILKGCGVSETFSDGVVAWSVALAWMACFMAWPCSWFSQSLFLGITTKVRQIRQKPGIFGYKSKNLKSMPSGVPRHFFF